MIKNILRFIVVVIELSFGIIESVFRTISGLLAIIRVRMHKEYDYKEWLKRDLADCETILELGCGSSSPILKIGYGYKTDAVDIFEPYISQHNRNNDYKSCRLENIHEMLLPEKTYDAVVILDVMEHLNRPVVEQNRFIERMIKCARKKVIIFAPNGFIENDEVDGDPWQAHISAWEPQDYQKYGFKVKGATGIRYILGKASLPKYHPYSVFAIVAMLSQSFIFNRPKYAWHSYAVKEIA